MAKVQPIDFVAGARYLLCGQAVKDFMDVYRIGTMLEHGLITPKEFSRLMARRFPGKAATRKKPLALVA